LCKSYFVGGMGFSFSLFHDEKLAKI